MIGCHASITLVGDGTFEVRYPSLVSAKNIGLLESWVKELMDHIVETEKVASATLRPTGDSDE